jgi:multiple sugar transport system permease protein
MTTKTRSRLSGHLFLLPYLTLFVAFMLLPLGYGLWLSFQKYEMLSRHRPQFVGVANYSEALGDPYFWKALRATCLFVVWSVPITVTIALLLALALDAVPGRRQEIYRLAIFVPTMITISVVGILWRWFYNGEFGVFNAILQVKAPWLTQPHWAMASIVLMTLWWCAGGPMVVLLAGLRQIPKAYFEAAALDGAVGARRFFSITLPLLKPVLLFVTVINVIASFQIFGQTFLVTRGGPELYTRVLVQYIYETAFNNYRLGYGAAMSWMLFLIIVTFSILQFRILREK